MIYARAKAQSSLVHSVGRWPAWTNSAQLLRVRLTTVGLPRSWARHMTCVVMWWEKTRVPRNPNQVQHSAATSRTTTCRRTCKSSSKHSTTRWLYATPFRVASKSARNLSHRLHLAPGTRGPRRAVPRAASTPITRWICSHHGLRNKSYSRCPSLRSCKIRPMSTVRVIWLRTRNYTLHRAQLWASRK